MWLMTDQTNPEVGQISPTLGHINPEIIEEDKNNKRKSKEILMGLSIKPNMQTILNSLSNLENDELEQLAKTLSRKGSTFLLELLNPKPKNQSLLGLTGIKKLAAWQLESLDDERVREILSEMDQARSSKIEEADHLKNKTG